MISSDSFFDVATTVARQAGVYQKSKLSQQVEIEFKDIINPVTEVDKKSEKMIVEAIQKKFPDHDILAEEGSGPRKDSPYKWIIDPLDGTVNFAHGYPLFAVSIGLEHNGQVVGGVVYDPNHDEMFTAFKNEGAFLNGKKICVSQTNQMIRAMMCTGFAYNLRQTFENNLDHFKTILMNVQAVRRDGTAAIDLCYVACGRYEGFWELNLFPWDTAAGLIMIEEAGGRVSRFDGSAYTVYEKDILVTNGLLHEEMVSLLKAPSKT